MSGPPFGDEVRRKEIARRYNPYSGSGPAARYDINFLLDGIDRRDAAIADLCVSLAAEQARHAEAAATGHTLSVTLDGDRVKLAVVCHEAEGADCRLTCTGDHDDCADPDVAKVDHPLADSGECGAALWINNEDDPAEVHAGDPEPLRDGMPITVEWDGGYKWRGVVSE